MTGKFEPGTNPYPSGTIQIWNGPIDEIPYGWSLCDGTDGTPNLIDRFIKSIPDTGTDPGATGGQHTLHLSTNQMPAHAHSGSTSSDGSHSHSGAGSHDAGYSTTGGGGPNNYGNDSASVQSGGAHSHSVSIDPVGNGDPIDNRPAYQEIVFIQKK